MSKFCELTKNIKHIGEVSTSRVDGSPTGAKILTSTNGVTGDVRDTLDGKLAKMDQQFQDRFNTLAPIPWTPNTNVTNALLVYSHIDDNGVERTYLPNPKDVPFTTSATWAEDVEFGRFYFVNLMQKDTVSVSRYKTDLNSWDDALALAINEACPKWVTYSDVELLSSASHISNKIIFPPVVMELKNSIPLRSGMEFELPPMCVVNFQPDTPKDLFVVSRDEIEQAMITHPNSWITATCNKVVISGGVFVGDLKVDGTGNATGAFRLGNCRWLHMKDVTIQRFIDGIWLAPYTLATAGRIGNFYECMFENVNITDCVNHWFNGNNVTTWVGGTIGQIIDLPADKKPDHFAKNVGAGLTWMGSNPAPIAPSVRPIRSMFYDKCAGSTYGGGYHEYNGTIFELDPIHRFGGFTFTPSHVFLASSTRDKIIRFTEGVMPYYNYDTETKFDPDLNTPNNHNELINMGFSIGSYSHVGDALDLPHYDFKYGLLNAIKNLTDVVEYDVRGHEDRDNGFVSRDAIRITPFKTKQSKFSIPIRNARMMMNVCVWYRDLYGNFDPSNGFTIADPNKAVIGQDYVDFGNGYRVAVLRLPTVLADNTRSLGIAVSKGECIEIENISCYQGGLPIFPTTSDYTPSANVSAGMCEVAHSYWNRTNSGIFRTGDIVYPSSKYDINREWIDTTSLVVKTNASTDVTYGGLGSDYDAVSGITLNFPVPSDRSIIEVPSTHTHVAFVGVPLKLDDGEYTVLRRKWDNQLHKFTSSLRLSEDVKGSESFTVLDQKSLSSPSFTKL